MSGVWLADVQKEVLRLTEKRTWVHNSFREMLKIIAQKVFLVLQKEPLERPVRIVYKSIQDKSDPYSSVIVKDYVFKVYNDGDLEVYVKEYEPGYEDDAIFTTLFVLRNDEEKPIFTYYKITVREIREFAEAFSYILSELHKELESRKVFAEETLKKLEKIRKALEVVQ